MAKCAICLEEFSDLDHVEASFRFVFHKIPSKIHYAIDKDSLEPIPGTLCHVECADSPDSYFIEG